MKICFSARPSYNILSTDLYLQLKKTTNNLSAIFVTQNSNNTSFIKSRIADAEIFEVSDFMEKNWETFNLDLLIKYENKYNCSPIWSYIYTDRFLINHDYDYIIKTTCGLFSFYESIFANNAVDYYYDETIAVLESYIAYIVSKHYKAKYISQMLARGFDVDHHYFINDPFQYNCNFDNDYKNKEYSNDIIKRAENFLSDFETTNTKPSYMSKTGKKPTFNMGFFKIPFIYLHNKYSKSLYNNKYDYLNYKGYIISLNTIKFYFRYLMSKKYYNIPDYNKKYVYFPLHYQPEASTLVCAQKYEKQLYFIDSWSKSLPADTVLYVKEHYAILGHRDLDFYQKLKKYPNVVLINPWIDSRELIMRSTAVTTLTGTAGWEAMLLRKPVFLGGNIFFDNAPGIIKIDDIFGKYVENINNWSKPTRDDIIKYLCEYISTIYLGTSNVHSPVYSHDNNIKNLAASLIKQTEKQQEIQL